MSVSRKLRAIVLGIFDKRQHTRQYMRLISWHLPGKAFKEWIQDDNVIHNAAKYGHLYILQYVSTKIWTFAYY